ncbi:MAG: FtsQ-type POTRA domain-containing protein [Clostridia bacterium]|nr:FtsQ-type POTRA domain-containing protein [Clostridia bacterium]
MNNESSKNSASSSIRRAVEQRQGRGDLRRDLRASREKWPDEVRFDLSEFDDAETRRKKTSENINRGGAAAPERYKSASTESAAKRRERDASYESLFYSDEDPPLRRKRRQRNGGLTQIERGFTDAGDAYAPPREKVSFKESFSLFFKGFMPKKREDESEYADTLDTSAVSEARGISHEARKRSQTRRDLIKMLVGVFAVLLFVAAIIISYKLSIVKTVTVAGSEKYSSAQLLSLSGIRTGKSILSYNADDLREAMNGVSDIRTLSVNKGFPNKIVITVEDLEASAAILAGDRSYVIISADGYVLNFEDKLPEGLVLILGMANTGFTPHTYIDRTNATVRTVAAAKLLSAIQSSSLCDKVISIDLSNSACVCLELPNDYKIILGSVSEAHECISTAAEAYSRFLPIYPLGGIINVFNGSSVVDFTPNLP